MRSTEQAPGGPAHDLELVAADDRRLADRLSELARSLEKHEDVDDTLEAIVHAAVGSVPGAGHASISAIRRRREVETRACTSALARAIDQAQYDSGEGPCLDALFERDTVRLRHLPGEQRWPDFTKRAVELGVGSMLAVRLFVQGDDLGALNLHSEGEAAFDDEAEHTAQLFASHAAVALAAAQQKQQLRRAVSTRQLVGQAEGILMERFKLNDDQAFRLLVRASQDTNRKLVEIAADLVRTGEVPHR